MLIYQGNATQGFASLDLSPPTATGHRHKIQSQNTMAMAKAMAAPFSRPRWSATALTWYISAFIFILLGSAPASLAASDGGSAGSDNNGDDDDDPCLLYLAQSTIPNGTIRRRSTMMLSSYDRQFIAHSS